MSDLAQRLRNLAERTAMEFDDATATEAADRIESLERENRDIKYIACQLGEDKLELERENADLLAALKDCEARLALLVHSGRSKMLDVRAAEKARATIARYEK